MVGKKILGAALGACFLARSPRPPTRSRSASSVRSRVRSPSRARISRQASKPIMALNGKSVKGHDVEVIYRDLPAANPAQARALAQELVVKDKVQYLGGVYFTPDAHGDHAASEAGEHAAGDLQCRDVGDHEHLAARGAHLLHHGADHDAARQGRGRSRHQESRSRRSAITAPASTRRSRSRRPSRPRAVRSWNR